MSGRSAEIHGTRRAYAGRYAIDVVEFSFDAPDRARRISHATREVFQRGDSAAALILDVQRNIVVLTEQYRVATHNEGPGYLLELCAGSVEAGEDAATCMRRELMEETGYRVQSLKPIACVYPSPGASSERLSLFLAEVTPADLRNPDASGVAAEDEAIRRVEFPLAEFFAKLERGEFQDGKIVAAGWWLKAHRGV